MQKKLAPKGVVIMALTDEPRGTVMPFAKKNKINYVVGIDSKATREAYGVRGFPTIILIDPEGLVAWTGFSGTEAEAEIERLLKHTPPSGGGWSEKWAKEAYGRALTHLKKERYDKALSGFEQVAKDFAETEHGKKAAKKVEQMRADETVMVSIREGRAAKKCNGWLQMARGLVKNGKPDAARKYYQQIIDEYPGTSFADTARIELAALPR
jgi:pentatricopeptide repeat protein